MFQELLDDIVPKDVGHQAEHARLHLAVQRQHLLCRGLGQPLLDETRPVLVAAELKDKALCVL